MILSINMYKGEAYEVNVHGGCMKYVLAKKKAKSSEVGDLVSSAKHNIH